MRKLKAFTLAEVMIVLTVIGVLTAILLPVAMHSMPDEDLMKFKKAHNTLGTVIRELVTSDKYYAEGDLGKRLNGNVNSSTFLCQTIADLVNAKSTNCTETSVGTYLTACTITGSATTCSYETDANIQAALDTACKNAGAATEHIVLPDDVVIFEPASKFHFGGTKAELGDTSDVAEGADGRLFTSVDENNFYRLYKFICIDIDGVPSTATSSDCVNECPFGYGLRVDGKLIPGARALEWLERDVNDD